MLSIIVPAYNESALIFQAVEHLIAEVKLLGIDYEIIIVDDGSKDDTFLKAQRLAELHPQVRVIKHEVNQRLGGAFRTGIKTALKDFVILCPVDSPLDENQFRKYLQAVAEADIVVGYRPSRLGYTNWLKFCSRTYTLALRLLLGVPLRDFNWICLYRRSIFNDIEITFSGIAFSPEILAKAHSKGYRLKEIESEMKSRKSGKGTVNRPSVMYHTFIDMLRLCWMIRFSNH